MVGALGVVCSIFPPIPRLAVWLTVHSLLSSVCDLPWLSCVSYALLHAEWNSIFFPYSKRCWCCFYQASVGILAYSLEPNGRPSNGRDPFIDKARNRLSLWLGPTDLSLLLHLTSTSCISLYIWVEEELLLQVTRIQYSLLE